MILLYIAIIALTSAITLAAREAVVKRAAYKRAVQAGANPPLIEKKTNLSHAGKNVTSLFEDIPDAHRPSVNIYDICRALDVKFGVTELQNHFTKYRDNGWDYSYVFLGFNGCGCEKGQCPYAEYANLAIQMKELIAAVREQNRVLELAEHSEGMREARTLMEMLDDSVHVVRSVTQEVSERVETN